MSFGRLLKRVSKLMVFKMASSGDFQNSQFWCAPAILAPVWVFPKARNRCDFRHLDNLLSFGVVLPAFLWSLVDYTWLRFTKIAWSWLELTKSDEFLVKTDLSTWRKETLIKIDWRWSWMVRPEDGTKQHCLGAESFFLSLFLLFAGKAKTSVSTSFCDSWPHQKGENKGEKSEGKPTLQVFFCFEWPGYLTISCAKEDLTRKSEIWSCDNMGLENTSDSFQHRFLASLAPAFFS